MKIYIAAPWKDRELAEAFARRCEDRGLQITHDWWNDLAEFDEHERLRVYAALDVEAVRNADVVIVLDTQKSEGKAFEQGLAIAWNKPIIAVGVRGSQSLNIFHHLPQYRWVPDTEGVWDLLLEMSNG